MPENPTVSEGEDLATLLETEWAAMVDLAGDFAPEDWATPTELPGWSVQDCYSHVAGTERALQGHPVPKVDLSGLDHLTAPSAQFTEPPVAARRGWSGDEVLDELRTVAAERVDELRALPPEKWEAVGPTPVGQATYAEFMRVRAFDCWMHEQDVRRALGRSGHQSGPVAEHSLGRCEKALGFVVGKKAGAPDGAVVVFDVRGPMARQIVVAVDGGRASVVAEAGEQAATVTLDLDAETLWCLGGGRWHPDAVMANGSVSIAGDADLGARIVDAMNFMI